MGKATAPSFALLATLTARCAAPNDYQALSFGGKPRYPILSYCRAGDPGHTVDVSPVEPTVRDILNLRITQG